MSTLATSNERDAALVRVYVWELPVRLTHWIIAFSIVVLSATGYYIGHPFISVPGAARDHFVMGTMRAIHLYAASVFTAAVIVRIYWWFAGNSYARWSDFIPVSRRRFRSLWHAMLFYSFIRREPEEYPGHNALAAGSYAMIFVVYALLIVTGLVLHAAEAAPGSPFHFFAVLAPWFYGLPMARLIHHVAMWVVLIFVVVHLHFVLLASLIERIGTFESIFSGFKFLPRKRVR
jgi:Ni/Fe-hydrogenase 1 B-type cytochrome subunit